jgi:hypothetical protein
MASTTTTKPTLVRQHETAVAAYTEAHEAEQAAKAAGDKATGQSQSARKANLSRRIGELELDMTLEGVEFTPWTKPENSAGSRLSPVSQEEIEANIAKVAAMLKASGTPDTVKHAADNRITALLKSAEKRGYKISDPRK